MVREEAEPVIACKPAGVPTDQRQRWLEMGIQIYGAVEELQELPDGYACRLPSDAATVLKAAEYVTLDRLCCTFARWELRLEPNGGPLWLRLTGPEGTKELTRSVFETTNLVNERVLRAAGMQPRERRTPEQVVAASSS